MLEARTGEQLGRWQKGPWPRATACKRGRSWALGSPVVIWSKIMNLSRAHRKMKERLVKGMTESQASLAWRPAQQQAFHSPPDLLGADGTVLLACLTLSLSLPAVTDPLSLNLSARVKWDLFTFNWPQFLAAKL